MKWILTYLDVPARKLGSMVRINGLFHLLINGIRWGYNPLILIVAYGVGEKMSIRFFSR